MALVAVVLLGGAVAVRSVQADRSPGESGGDVASSVHAPPPEQQVPAAAVAGAAPLSVATPAKQSPTPVAPTPAPAAAQAPASPLVADLSIAPPAPSASLPNWVTTVRETGLWSGPTEGTLFSKIPTGVDLRVYDRQGARLRVFYPGDRASRRPGEAWIDAVDSAPIAWPRFIRLRSAGELLTRPGSDGQSMARLSAGTFVEVIGEPRGAWAPVFYLGDGRVGPTEGWLESTAAVTYPDAGQTATFSLTRDLLKTGAPEVWLRVPYRRQFDGSPFEEANCGPTVLNMVLERFGLGGPQAAVRHDVLALQPDENCDDCGVYVENLASVAASRGLQVRKLRDADPAAFHTWTQDEIKAELRAGRPVVLQAFYRALPGRATSPYYGDHYIVVHGLIGDRFIFNDPIDVEGPGYSRLITAQQLDKAMANSDFPYAGFAVGR